MSSLLKQWETEIVTFLKKDSVRLFVLRDPNTSPAELLKHDIILVSYHFVMSQYRRMRKYIDSVSSIKEGVVTTLRRPNTTIFSDIFYAQGEKSPFLVLDEITAVKNSSSTTFQAIHELRCLADACIGLTGSPLDNTWFDLYAYFQLILSHDIRSKVAMRSLFSTKTAKGRWGRPIGNQMRRLLQMLNSFIVRRPKNTIPLPPLHVRTVRFDLTEKELANSAEHAEKYLIIINCNSDAVPSDTYPPWRRLTLAIQHACHPALEKIMHLVKNPKENIDEDHAASDVISEAKDIQEWEVWREEITRHENWRSSRINTIIDIFNQFRDKDPDCSVIVFDDSVYFLDIIEVAFSNMFEPEACLRYDGRTVAMKRSAILTAFAAAGGPRVLLISSGAGGFGLNITAANKVILCGPWWKMDLEEQAIGRAHRPGQERPVEVVKVQADCEIELYKTHKRDSKNRHNLKIVDNITRLDGVVPKAWDNLE